MPAARGTEQDPDRVINPGGLFAMGLIDEASHLLIHHYTPSLAPHAISEALQWYSSRLGKERFDQLLLRFVQEFPGATVFRGEETAQEWLRGSTDGVSHREAAFEELMMLWLANTNPAFRSFLELFDDEPLEQQTPYPNVTNG